MPEDEIPSPDNEVEADSDSDVSDNETVAEDKPKEKKEQPPLKSQLSGIALLIVVFGFLYLVVEFLPSFGDWLGGSLKGAMGEEQTEVIEESTKTIAAETTGVEPKETQSPEPPQLSAAPLAQVETPAPGNPNAAGLKIEKQIVDALGGPDFCEIIYCAFSEDKTQLISELKIKDATGASKEIEVIFERDTFGRYLSVEDSPLQKQIKVRP